jgi:hypothetical protein
MRFIIFRIAITGVEFSLFVHREGEAGTRDSGNMAEHDGKKETKRNEEKRRETKRNELRKGWFILAQGKKRSSPFLQWYGRSASLWGAAGNCSVSGRSNMGRIGTTPFVVVQATGQDQSDCRSSLCRLIFSTAAHRDVIRS